MCNRLIWTIHNKLPVVVVLVVVVVVCCYCCVCVFCCCCFLLFLGGCIFCEAPTEGADAL